jgi:GNAT superfamily N-acetyltransferase
MIALRPAKSGDGPAIAHVHVEAWRAAYGDRVPPQMLAAVNAEHRVPAWVRLIDHHQAALPTIVAVEDDGAIIGFSTASPGRSPAESFDAELHTIFVRPPYQRRDIGRRLFHAVAQRLIAAGDRSMMCWVLAQPQAEAFLTALGGRLISTTPIDAFGQSLAQHLYVWTDLDHLPPQPGI